MRLSIKARLTAWYTALMLLIAATLVVTLLMYSRQTAMDYAARTLEDAMDTAVRVLDMSDGGFSLDRDHMNAYPDVSLAIYDTQGVRLYGSRTRFGVDPVEGGMRTITGYDGSSWYVMDRKIQDRSSETYWLRAYTSPASYEFTMHSALMLALAIFPALTLAAAVGGYLLTRRAFRPVATLSRTAMSIADGDDLNRRLDGSGARDELGDLTDTLNAMLSRLQASFERERRFTSDAAHELKTPVAGIIAQAEWAMEHGDAGRRQALKQILKSARRLSAMTAQLLTLSRMDAGRQRVVMETVNLSELVLDVAQEMEPAAQERSIRMETDIEADISRLCDQSLITRALINLISNAIKYGREGGYVRVSLARSGEKNALICVEDDGLGIAPEHMERIWERFYQVDPSRADEGAGLGLSMVAWIARRHGGRAWAESENSENKKGSRFFILL